LLLADRTPCRINNAPDSRNGVMINSDAGLPEADLKNIPSAIDIKIKSAPPVISYFQAKTRTIIKRKAGMLCTRNPRICLPRGFSPPNESSENKSINRIARIARILGNQYKILSFIIDFFEFTQQVTPATSRS
jgi:hypothetical protein